MKWFLITVVLCTICDVKSYRHYQQNIPNGEHVPHPCKPNYIWHGVGHERAGGGGDRNPFGIHFANASHVWTKALCQTDSDGDDKTNGEELGDPKCVWKKGDLPERTTDISHPGVCDPVNSPGCMTKNEFVDCNPESDFRCDALNETETRNITIRFPETVVPPKETNYYCMVFELPQDGDYHLIATTPHIDNKYVMHHILLFGCDESQGPVTEPLNMPEKCAMGNSKCNSIIGLWAVGGHGECLDKDIGIRFGSSGGYKKAMFQFHWNNPELKTDYNDSSGMNLFYTPVLRKYDAGVLMTGQHYLKIPSRQDRVVQSGSCSPVCTQRQILGPVNITRAFNHMHYLGREMKIELFRNGTKIQDITNEEVYSYDSPVTFNLDPAIEVFPGDEIKTTCVFTSKYKTETTFYGDGTQEEMCYGFLTFHPVQNIPLTTCTSWKSLPTCKIWFDRESFPVIDGCNWLEIMDTPLIDDVINTCRPPNEGCLPECLEKVKTIKDHPCLNNDIGDYIRFISRWDWKRMNFFSALDLCQLELSQADQSNCTCNNCNIITSTDGRTTGDFTGTNLASTVTYSAFIMFTFNLFCLFFLLNNEMYQLYLIIR